MGTELVLFAWFWFRFYVYLIEMLGFKTARPIRGGTPNFCPNSMLDKDRLDSFSGVELCV